jgi:flagellar hook-associated protein 2
MGGITTGVGLFSGIDSASLIDQLINAQSRPQLLAQQRVVQLQQQQAGYLDINSRLNTFKLAAASFRVDNIFSSRSVNTSNESVLSASASSSAVPGSYNFIVDRLVSTQQLLTRGFANQDSTAIGLDSLTFESDAARLDTDTALADLNDGNGINRGVFNINGTEVDISRAGSVQEVLDAISQVPDVTARVENNKFVITGVTSLTEETGSGLLESLGFSTYSGSETDLTGSSVYGLNINTTLQSLNDGRGVAIREASGDVEDFTILIDSDLDGIFEEDEDTIIKVRIGEIEGTLLDDEGNPILDDEGNETIGVISGAVSDIGGVIGRINDALSEGGFSEISASINSSTGGIDINDGLGRGFLIENFSNSAGEVTTAEDLGIAGSYLTGNASGDRILAGLNTKLISSLNGGNGLNGSAGDLRFQTADGSDISIDISGLSDINDIINAINNIGGADAGKLSASVNSKGTGLEIRDNTTGVNDLIISDADGLGVDSAAALGIAGTFTDGVSGGSNLQVAYIGEASLLSDLNYGDGIGTGEFEITDSFGNSATITINSSDKTIGDVLKKINNASGIPNNLEITARINDNGDGIAIYENASGPNGPSEISITNVEGTVATKLNIEGTATGIDGDNFIDGSFEQVVEFDSDATLQDVRDAINSANVGVAASILNTGIGNAPFRLNFTSELTGEDGRFLVDAGDFDLGTTVLDVGNNARVFFGSSDAASGVLLDSTTNQLDGVIQGVTIDLLTSSDDPVEISVSTDTPNIESKIQEFVDAFNSVVEGIDFRTRFDQETEVRGILLGDSTLLNLRNGMFNALRRENDGFTSTFDSLTEVGIKLGSGAKLEFDSEQFREAYAEDPQAVEDLFARQELQSNDDNDPNTIDEPTFATLSVLGQLEEFADSYVTSIGGVLQNRTNAIDAQIELQNERIESLQANLDNKRLILERQFLAMEQAIGAFQTQGSSLAQLAALG